MFVTSERIKHSNPKVDMTLFRGLLKQNAGPGHVTLGLPSLCTGTDCNVKASRAKAEIADSVNVIRIVTNAFFRNCVCTPV